MFSGVMSSSRSSGSPEIINTDLSSLIRSISDRNSLESVIEKLERISRTRQALTRNANPRLAVEVLFMGLAGITMVKTS